MEQTVYQNIDFVLAQSHQSFRFKEQVVMFDFHPVTSLVHMQVQDNSEVNRFERCAVPRWFGTSLAPPDFTMTQNLNSV